jgi:hypothetical protein
VTTLKAMKLNIEHRDYACAMFANAREFVEWARVEAKAVTFVKQSNEKLLARFHSLRAEVAERYNGSYAFLPGAPEHDTHSPLREHTGVSPGDHASDFRWYR